LLDCCYTKNKGQLLWVEMVGKSTLKRLWAKSFLRYLVIGGTAYITEIASLLLFTNAFKWSSVLAVAVSFWIGFIIAFTLQKFVTFNNYERSVESLTKQVVGYSALVLWNYFFTLITVALISDSVPVYITRTFCIIAITSWNFIIYSKLFKQRAASEQKE